MDWLLREISDATAATMSVVYSIVTSLDNLAREEEDQHHVLPRDKMEIQQSERAGKWIQAILYR